MVVNGNVSRADVRTINNTTYVPLRAVSELLGASVGFDSKTQITEKAEVATRKHPAKIGQQASFQVSGIIDNYKRNISISEVIRGEQDWKLITEANQFNSAPEEGYEYILAKINVWIGHYSGTRKGLPQQPILKLMHPVLLHAAQVLHHR